MTAVRWRWLIGAGAVLAAVIAAGCLWYARPMTLEELEFDQLLALLEGRTNGQRLLISTEG